MEKIKDCEDEFVVLTNKYKKYISNFILNLFKSSLNSTTFGKYNIDDIIIQYKFDNLTKTKLVSIYFVSGLTGEILMVLSEDMVLSKEVERYELFINIRTKNSVFTPFIFKPIYKKLDDIGCIQKFTQQVSKILQSFHYIFILNKQYDCDEITKSKHDGDSDNNNDMSDSNNFIKLKYDNDIGYEKIDNVLIKINDNKKYYHLFNSI